MKTKCIFKYNTIATKLLVIVFMFISQFSFAQDRLSFELRPGVNFATQELAETKLATGFGAEGTFAYRFMPHLAVYAGWSWNKFGSDQETNGVSLDYEETGYTYGLQFIHPIKESKVSVLLRAGGLSNHIEVEDGDEIIADSGHGFGWQVEGGLALSLTEKWSLMPSVRYRSFPTSRNSINFYC